MTDFALFDPDAWPGASPPDEAGWEDCITAAHLFAVDPAGLGGISVHARPGPACDAWLAMLRSLLAPGTPFRRMPAHIQDERLLGGIDLAATLRTGELVLERGILAEVDGGVLVIPMAERMEKAVAARVSGVLDRGYVALERDGLTEKSSAVFGVVLLDESEGFDESPPPALLDRLAFHMDLSALRYQDLSAVGEGFDGVRRARQQLGEVHLGEEQTVAICKICGDLAIGSTRAPSFALRAARSSAALDGRNEVTKEDLITASRLVLAPRAQALPEAPAPPPPDPAENPRGDDPQTNQDVSENDTITDILMDATQSAIPKDLLSLLQTRASAPSTGRMGRMGAKQRSPNRGRPIGARQGDLRRGQRLNVCETLRAAAPWQKLRKLEAGRGDELKGLRIHPEDFRITKFQQKRESTIIIVVDASGSAALQRLSEAKGAVELLLGEAYLRRDQVALIAFRDRNADLLLPPTRSLVRAKRNLAGMPAGGGTPLASALQLAHQVSVSERTGGRTPVIILLTDGRANIALSGNANRGEAEKDALTAGGLIRAEGFSAVLIDTAIRAEPFAAKLAQAMGAKHVPLPYADAKGLSAVVRSASRQNKGGVPRGDT